MSVNISLDSLQTDSVDRLMALGRSVCPKCAKSCSLYCPHCLLPIRHLPTQVKLPITLDIYRHPQEHPTKSTTTHPLLISPNQVTLNISKTLKLYDQPERILLLFPSPSAKSLSEININEFDRLIVIDGTWSQAKSISNSVTQPFQFVKLSDHFTLFWRFQKYDPTYL
jgi:DTW domain-containing protein YfiP